MNTIENRYERQAHSTSISPDTLVPPIQRLERLQWRLYISVLVIFDLLMTFAAFRAAYWIRFYSGLPFFTGGNYKEAPFYDSIMLAVIPIWVIIFGITGLYNRQNLLGGTREYSGVINAVTFGMLLIVIARFSLPDSLILARGWAFSAWALAIVFTGVCRFSLRRVVYSLREKGYFRTNTLIVGYNEEGRLMAEQLYQNPFSSMNLVGYITSEANQCAECAVPLLPNLGTLDQLDQAMSARNVSRLLISNSALSREQVLALFRRYANRQGTELFMSSGLYEMLTTGMHVYVDGSVPLVKINRLRMTGFEQLLKNMMDFSLSVALLIPILPILLVVSVLIKLDSPGPILYRRRVIGINGKLFDAFKLRTMDIRSEEILRANPELLREYRQNFKIKHDPRVTRIGRILRKLSLDELPQIFNVLRGEMSLVGPRMITPEELDKYNQWGQNLQTVKPGITGFWQVHGRSDVSYEERVRMDMYYIRNWSIWLDLQLLMRTIPAVLAKRGAY